jgi:hypothetical protein
MATPKIEIDMDRKCQRCGKGGAVTGTNKFGEVSEGKYCMKCIIALIAEAGDKPAKSKRRSHD